MPDSAPRLRRPAPTLIACLSPNRGGMELDTLKMLELLAPHVELTLLCQQGSFIEQEARKRALRGVHVAPVRFRCRTLSPAVIRAATRCIAERGIRNVIFFGALELKSLYFAFRRFDLNVIVRHGTTKGTPKKDWLHRKVYSCVDHHVAISEHLRRNVEQIVPLGQAQTRVIYPSLATSWTGRSSQEAQGVVRLVHLGRLVPGKGQLEAVKACTALAAAGVRFELTLVGSVEARQYLARLEAAVAALPDPAAVRIIGHSSDPGRYLREADVFLFPSHGEGFGNAFIEAAATGLVPITFRNTVFPEFQRHGLHFHMATDGDQNELNQIVLRVAMNLPAELREASINRPRAAALWAPERELEEWLALLADRAAISQPARSSSRAIDPSMA